MKKHFYSNGNFKMELYDISRGILNAPVYNGDSVPKREIITSVEGGDDYTISSLSLTSHSATHIDAPSHTTLGGMTVDEIPLYMTTGLASVVSCDGILDKEKIEAIVSGLVGGEFGKRILVKGNAEFTEDGARVLRDRGVFLVGVEGVTIGDLSVHRALLENGVVILENLDLQGVNDGYYFLTAVPILIEGGDGAPCRAILHKI